MSQSTLMSEINWPMSCQHFNWPMSCQHFNWPMSCERFVWANHRPSFIFTQSDVSISFSPIGRRIQKDHLTYIWANQNKTRESCHAKTGRKFFVVLRTRTHVHLLYVIIIYLSLWNSLQDHLERRRLFAAPELSNDWQLLGASVTSITCLEHLWCSSHSAVPADDWQVGTLWSSSSGAAKSLLVLNRIQQVVSQA